MAQISVLTNPKPDPTPQVLDRKVRMQGLISACVGNLIEWFDFFVYAYTAIYFAPSFFPAGDQTSQLMATAGVFAVGFFMRPIGGWLFGWLADTRGRKVSMIVSVGMMSVGSLMITLTPNHAAIGLAAPVLLLIARLLQGLSVGAEYGNSATYISEIATKGRRGLFGSFQYFTIIAGQLLALLIVVILQHALSPDDMKAWGWRVPFAIGALSSIVVIYLRRSMQETATKESMRHKEAGRISGLLQHRRAFLLVLTFTASGSLYFYIFTTYMQKFLVISAKMSPDTASTIMTAALICYMLLQPVFGYLCDRIGIKANMMLFNGLAAVCILPLLFTLKSITDPFAAFGLIVCGFVISAFYTSIAGLVKADLFPAPVRALGVGFPYAIANALFGGTAEYVALSLRASGVETYFFFYAAGFCVLGFLAAVALPNLNKHGYLDGDGDVERNIGFRRGA